MAADRRRVIARRALLLISFLGGLLLLVWVFRKADLERTVVEIRRLGITGSGIFVASFVIAFLGPTFGWHLLLRAGGIPLSFRTTLASALMGRACNTVSPLMYFGGESVRTFHIAHACGVARHRVLATVIASEFQLLAALTASMIVACGIMAATSPLAGRTILFGVFGVVSMTAFLLIILGLFLGERGPVVRGIDGITRLGVFPRHLASVRASALRMEHTVREIFTRRRGTFLAAQALTFLSPVAQFACPSLFYALARRAGSEAPLPSFSELSVFFVLSQLIFMLPATPGGIGMYEGGLIGIFTLLGWQAHEGAAFGFLFRLDDLLFLLLGTALIIHYGMTRFFGGNSDLGGDAPEGLPAMPVTASGDPVADSSGVSLRK